MKTNIWLYQHESLKNLPGERWKDMPGFDGEYEISNLGRVKSLRRWRSCGSNAGYYTTEKIRKQSVRRKKNHLLNECTYTIGITLKKNGKSITSSTARYVYFAFVKPFDLDDKELLISYKDCDGRHLDARNLLLTNRSDLMKRSHRLRRSRPKFEENALPVFQLTMSGKKIAAYTSLKEAQEKTGFVTSAIAACVDGRIYQSHGFRWVSPSKTKPSSSAQDKSNQFFNEYLWKKMGEPKTSHTNPIATLNLRPQNMKGERWKPIQGLENAFRVSNLGRIKGLARFKEGRVNTWTKELTKRLIPDGKRNKPTSCLLVSLTKNGRKFQQSVARLVHHHFVKPIDLSDRKIRIGYKNGKYYDLHWKNLLIERNSGLS
ncbi:MAG TPA: NUMOD4 domain-containing protein [Puia sp.]|jgi:hypothetical protein